jgi:hypothetical protein
VVPEEGGEITIDLTTKGYKYELLDPVPVTVTAGRIRGKQRAPIEHYMPKPGVEYGADAQFLPEGYLKTLQDGGAEPASVSNDIPPSP